MQDDAPTVQDSVVTGDLHVGDINNNQQTTNVDKSINIEGSILQSAVPITSIIFKSITRIVAIVLICVTAIVSIVL